MTFGLKWKGIIWYTNGGIGKSRQLVPLNWNAVHLENRYSVVRFDDYLMKKGNQHNIMLPSKERIFVPKFVSVNKYYSWT